MEEKKNQQRSGEHEIKSCCIIAARRPSVCAQSPVCAPVSYDSCRINQQYQFKTLTCTLWQIPISPGWICLLFVPSKDPGIVKQMCHFSVSPHFEFSYGTYFFPLQPFPNEYYRCRFPKSYYLALCFQPPT